MKLRFAVLALIIGLIAWAGLRWPWWTLASSALLMIAFLWTVAAFLAGSVHQQQKQGPSSPNEPTEADAYKAATAILEPFDHQARCRVVRSLSQGVLIKQHEASIQQEKRGPVRVGSLAQ